MTAVDIEGAVRLIGESRVRECREMLRRTARHEVWLLGQERFARGTSITCRAVVYRDAVGQEDRLADLRRRTRCGEAIRLAATQPADMVIVDRRWALISVVARGQPTEMLLVCGSSLLTTLVAAYETWWREATPLAEVVEDSVRAPVDPRLVTLLSAGLTDKSIARELGIGLRTVERQVSALLCRLGARTRFQAGLRLGRPDSGSLNSRTLMR